MLADKFIETWPSQHVAAATPQYGAEAARRAARVHAAAVKAAQRFVLSPLTVETIDDLAQPEAVERTREYLFTPAVLTWIEFNDGAAFGSGRHGLLLMGETQSIHHGLLTFVERSPTPEKHRFDYLVGHADYNFIPPGPMLKMGEELVGLMGFQVRKVAAWIGAALALINSPHLCDKVPHDLSRHNSKRQKRNLPPILSYHDVNLTIDRGGGFRADELISTGGRAYHHVRAHMRLRLGRVELVRPHWRGDPMIGTIRTRHLVRRAEDEGGEWAGGPLPAPRFIKPEEQ